MSSGAVSGPLYLSESHIASLAIKSGDVIECVERALRNFPINTSNALKSTVRAATGSYFQALPSLMAAEGVACVKWVSVIAGKPEVPSVHATILLSSARDGSLIAILDGRWITAVRTAAMSALAARALVRPDAENIGFVGCGAQAMAHLDAFRSLFPDLRSVVAYARSERSVSRMCDHATRLGLSVQRATSAQAAVEKLDIIISSVPAATMTTPQLHAGWLKPGAFVSMVDLGRSWHRRTLDQIEIVTTDDRAQSSILAKEGKLNHPGPYAYDLSELVVMSPGALSSSKRSTFIFGGIGICDAYVASLCYKRALDLVDVGQRLT